MQQHARWIFYGNRYTYKHVARWTCADLFLHGSRHLIKPAGSLLMGQTYIERHESNGFNIKLNPLGNHDIIPVH